MSYIDDIIEKYKQFGLKVSISFACDFPTTRGRFPDSWSAYSISKVGFKTIPPITAFPTLEDLDQNIRFKFRSYLNVPNQDCPSDPKQKKPARPVSLNMIDAKKLEMKFANKGIYCNIAPAASWQLSRLAALHKAQNPDLMWGITIYDTVAKRWYEVGDAYYSLRNVAGALTELLKQSESAVD
ncbi:MAG TPA: hypothetical protein VJ508_20810 [Saprospiraceae bacterium]|nr:hypothetical protein [Saprospiraceae bacterium]